MDTMEDTMRFVMADRGSAFSTRDLGIKLLAELERVEAESDGDHDLILDFDGVTHISDSFTDEFVCNVVAQRRSLGLNSPDMQGMSPFVEKIISRAMNAREMSLTLIAG